MIDTGEHLWSVTTEARPGKTYVDERYVGHFYQHGLVWLLAKNSPRTSDGQNVWRGLGPRTGQERRVLRTQGEHPHACGCFSEVMRGFLAVHSSQEPPVVATPARLETGPANARQAAAPAQPDDCCGWVLTSTW